MGTEHRVAIMQPTYLPWMGYVAILDQADVFVLLDTVALSHQSWQTRNRVVGSQGNEIMLSIPVHNRLGQLLHDVEIAEDGRWRRQHRGTLEGITNKAHRDTVGGLLALYNDPPWDRLTAFTGAVLRLLAQILGIRTPIVNASDYGLPVRTSPFDRIADILERTGATEWLEPAGGRRWLGELDYLPVGGNPNFIPIRFQEYDPVPYEQGAPGFQPRMSVVDALLRHGPEKTIELVREGARG